MPRYFFHVADGKSLPDDEGVELSDASEARAQAVVAAGEALRDKDGRFWNNGEWSMHVVDESGKTVCRLTFSGQSE